MKALGRVALVLAGALGASAASAVVGGCGGYFECDHVVRGIDPGSYPLSTDGPRTEIGEDVDYRLEVSADATEVVETFTRSGRAHRNVYSASAPRPSPLRSNRGADAD